MANSLDALRMHLVRGVRETGEEVWYTGRAGEQFVSTERCDAYEGFDLHGARRKAAALNRMTMVHGIHFMAPCPD